MNNLKFRVWELPSQKFWYDMDDLFKNPSVIPSEIFNGNDGLLFINQWSGLRDSKGKDVYEGDIVATNWNKPMVVEFKHGCFQLAGLAFSQYSGSEMTVIGNRYETPELLA